MEHEAIWKRARADLLLPSGRGENDLFLWEHSWRIARSAQQIAALPEVLRFEPDLPAVIAAALYHAAGWAARCRSGACDRPEILLGPFDEGDREEGAVLLQGSLREVLSRDSLQRALTAVRTQHDHGAASAEARIVADARSLQEFGLLALWPMIRRGIVEGKAVQAVLDSWNRKKEYHFWEARLADSFHFESVRGLAGRRLQQLERFVVELKGQHYGEDVAELASRAEDVGVTGKR